MSFKRLCALQIIMVTSFNGFAEGFDSGKVIEDNYSVSLPFELINNAMFITLPIEGIDYKFLLDTAAPNIINSKLIQNHRLEKNKYTANIADANGMNQEVQMYNLPDIKIGDATFNGFTASFVENLDEFPFSCFDAAGIIGYNTFKYSVVTFDFIKKTVTFSDSAPNDLSKDGYIPVGFFFGFRDGPLINLHHEFGNMPIILDTAFDGGLLIEDEYIQYHLDEMGYIGKKVKGGLVNYSVNGLYHNDTIKFYELDNLEFGRLKVERYPVKTSLSNNNSLMGIDFLKQYHLIVDYKSGVAWFKPNGINTVSNVVPKFGVYTKVENEQIIVDGILEGSLADLSGVKSGQKITKVNEIKLTAPLSDKYRCNMFDSNDEILSMEIKTFEGKLITLK
ncbi:retroviral-like aspartic protease family protein [Aliivibrio fischeri]|uniref:retroviral-like aspartic protease family protein n=1 Tax=Aliivibrio fischeri TaxID=668 RepID=UPI000907E1BA|nr:retroviral-like aspartic protease family protein [Aliivibrio fischeri]